MNTKDIALELDEALTSLLQLLSSFSREQINVVPFKGSWTAGQLAKHLVMSGTWFIRMVNGPVKETERKPDEMVDKIKKALSDASTKLKSPDFIVPPDQNYEKDELLDSIEDIKSRLGKSVETLDLAKTCRASQIPGLGFLTRLEAIYFVIYHTQRHNLVLKNIYENVVVEQ